ncbi:MAG: C/D box methylation guide ribonucleoprotein complex aNOP56 subunit [Candidatus Methanomethylicia archaeon]
MSSLECFFIDTPIGFIVFNSDGSVLAYEFFSGELEDIVSKLLKLEDGKVVDELRSICNKLKNLNVSRVFFDAERIIQLVKRYLIDIELCVDPSNPLFNRFRGGLPEVITSLSRFSNVKDYYLFIHELSIALSRHKLRKIVEKRDLLLAQAINAIDDVNKIINMMVSRLREWYSVHFPELDHIVDDHKLYANIISEIGSRNNFNIDKLYALGFSKNDVDKIMNVIRSSIGADFNEYDINAIKNFAKILCQLYDVKSELENYIDSVADDVCPNLKALVGSLISARLISLAGGLDKLAKLPSSTIQVLGAEKALFRALRSGAKPPKHGIIFQCQEIHSAPRWQRGKIARALAGKLSIAARVDVFSGVYVGDELKRDLYKRIEEIKKLYPKPIKRRVEVKERRKARGRK